MQTIQFTCDICGAQKGETNHWWKLVMVPGGFHLFSWDEFIQNSKHLCGRACVIKQVEAFMGKKPESTTSRQ